MVSNFPAHKSVSPTSLSSKCALMPSSPWMNLGQYCHFLIRALAKKASKASIQLWDPCCQIVAAQELWDDPCPPQELSTTSCQRWSNRQYDTCFQMAVVYRGQTGTNMNPGHVNLFFQMLMLSSRQFLYPGTKFSTMFTTPTPPPSVRSPNTCGGMLGGGGGGGGLHL